jgi:hypothetical protein
MNITASDLIGTWILQSAVFRFEDDGESVEYYGARPTGVATFTKEGRLIAIVSSGGRPATGDDASKARLFDAAMAYSGKFEVSGETFITLVDAATIPEWLGSRQLRYMQFDGEVLTLRTPVLPSPRSADRRGHGTLTWRRET